MPVPAIELKPRGAIALFDSAIRLCARSSGVWALTLCGGALVTWAVLQLAGAITRGTPVLVPATLFTFAWLARGVFQGAACHHLEGLLLATEPPSAWESLRAAMARLPSLLITAVFLPVFNVLSLGLTLGLGYFLIASHLVGWAAVMKGKGHPLALYGTCAKMLGPARQNAMAIRLLFSVILLVGFNLHLAANVLIYLGRKLIGIDLSYAQRFASLDNAEWVTVLCALAFTLFEPLRAAVATLMLIDGRVRQDGLDLLSSVEQLPARQKKKPGLERTGAAAAVLLACMVLFSPGKALAQEDSGGVVGEVAAEQAPATRGPDESLRPAIGSTPMERLVAVARACGEADLNTESKLQGAEALAPADRAALRRLADDVELFAWTWQDCDAARQRLQTALPLVQQTIAETQQSSQQPAAEKAKAILARPEFVPTAKHPNVKDAPQDEDPSGWWARLKTWFRELVRELLKDRNVKVDPGLSGSGAGAANVIVIVLVVAVVVLVVVLLAMALRGKGGDGSSAEVVSEGSAAQAIIDSESALSRPPEGWASLADELAAQGNFRDAVRSLYLALLSRLHRMGAIDYDPTLSNWDYCRQFRGHREWVPMFRDLTTRFDFAWYGHFEVDHEGYTAFRRLTEPILSVREAEPPHA